jgi:ribonuclease D
MRPLTEGMLDYAAQDTINLLELRDHLKDELERAGRWEWAREEFSLLEGTKWSNDDAANAFMRIKGARDLTRRELAILRELAPWRDSIARQLDRATFRVLGNEQLLDVSRQQPATREALATIKGMPRGILESRGHELLDAVKKGLAVPEADLPRFPKSARWDRDPDFDARVNALKTARDAIATRLDLDPGVLGARDRMEAVARKNPTTPEEMASIPELKRWQLGVLGEDFLKALRHHRKPATTATPAEPDVDESPYK